MSNENARYPQEKVFSLLLEQSEEPGSFNNELNKNQYALLYSSTCVWAIMSL